MSNIQLEFVPQWPKEYDPTIKRNQWMDVIPNLVNVDPGFLWVMPRNESTMAELIAKGVNRFTRSDMGVPGWTQEQVVAFRDQGYGYDDVPQTPTQFGLGDRGPGASEWVSAPGVPTTWPNIWNRRFFNTQAGATEPMPASEGAMKGNQYNTDHTLVIFENTEQDHAISSHWSFVKAWAANWVPRVINRWPGKKVIVCWNYFSGFGKTIRWGNKEEKKALLHLPLSQWEANPMLPGGDLELFNGVCFGVYMGAPDDVNHVPYDFIYNAYIARKANKFLVCFTQGFHEWMPNVKSLWTFSDGKYYADGKMAISPNIGFANMLFVKIFGDCFAPFSMSGKYVIDEEHPVRIDREWHQGGIWIPAGQTEPVSLDEFPHWGKPERYPGGGISDYTGFAAYYFDRTFGYVIGGTEEWCDYRADGGAWVPAVNSWADDVCNAYYGSGYFVYSKRKNNIISFLVFNGKASDSVRHKVEWKYQGQIFEGWIAGTIPYCVNYTLS